MSVSARESSAGDGTGMIAVHERLRSLILDGKLKPGVRISQVKLAKHLDVSRTPLREALRMLQQEGLVVAEPNQQVRVADMDLADLEHVYSHRLLLEALGIRLTVPALSEADLSEICATLDSMEGATRAGDDASWHELHVVFHRQLVMHCPATILDTIGVWQTRASRYRLGYIRLFAGSPRSRSLGEREHREILDACAARDAQLASTLLARHLARTALTLATELHPEHDPAVLRAALQVVVHGTDSDAAPLSHLPSE